MNSMLHSGLVLATLEDETNGARFEDFCAELMSAEEQKLFLKTSQNYDQQRDGRSQDDSGQYICAGATKDLHEKAKKDIAGLLLKTDNVHRVLVCGRENLSEYALDKVRKSLCDEFPTILTISLRGGLQLAELSVRHPEVFNKHYQAEYKALFDAKTNPIRPSEDNRLNGLRLAASIQLHDTAQLRRSEIVKSLIVEALEKTGRATVPKLTRFVSEGLKLPTILEHSWFVFELNRMKDSGIVTVEDDEQYVLTAKGLELAGQRREFDGQFVADFKEGFRKAVYELTGSEITSPELDFLWKTLEEGLIAVFVGHGADLIRSVHRLVDSDIDDTAYKTEGLRELLTGLCDRIANLPGGGGRLNDISSALSDMFCDPSTAAFEYLSRICDAFIHVCSLGLEPNVNDAIIDTIQNSEVYLDTDVLLSLLSPGESNHAEVKVLLDAWRQKGGAIYAPKAALEEASHHAFIADRDYQNVESMLVDLNEGESYRYINNVFVRGYWHESKNLRKKFSRSTWDSYISIYRGRSDHDSSKIEALLPDNDIHSVDAVDEQSNEVLQLSDRLQRNRSAPGGRSSHAIREKCSRDARTGILLDRVARDNPEKNVILLSTSRSVRNALQILSQGAHNRPLIWYLPSIAWVLAQCPGVTVTASTLQKVLFSVDVQGKLTPLERTCVRAARISDEHDFHWSRKPALMDAVRSRIRSKAAELAIKEHELEDRIVNANDSDEIPAQILASALDEISITKSEREIADLRERLKGK